MRRYFWSSDIVSIVSLPLGYKKRADIWSLGITVTEMAKSEPPLADLPTMRVLFIIPRENPPQVDEHFSLPMREFISLCLKMVPAEVTIYQCQECSPCFSPVYLFPFIGYHQPSNVGSYNYSTTVLYKFCYASLLFRLQRPSAKDLLKHRFIRNARKSPRLQEREESVQSTSQWKMEKALWLKGTVKGSDTVKVKKDIREETVKASQGKTVKNTGWDFSIGRNHTGTIRSNVRPPQVRERKSEVSQNKVASRRAEDSSNWLSPTGSALSESSEVSFRKDAKDQYPSEDDNFHEDEDSSTKGPGTIVIRCPRGSQTSLFSHDQSTLSRGTNASFEDASTTGIVVFHGQQDGSESPWTPKSRFGIQERSSSASLEDSALNLAEARAAIQAGMRSGNARERPALSKIRDALGNISREHASKSGSDSSRNSREYFDAPKVLPSSCNASDDEESAHTLSASAHLSVLLIPSLKEVTHDDTDGPLVRAVTNSLVNLERVRAGSCEFLMSKLLQMLFKGTIAEGLAGTSNPHFLKGHNMSARLR